MTTVSEMTELLRQDWGKPVDEGVIRLALDILAKDGLLAPCPALSTGAGVSRRELLQKLGTGAAMAVPLVTVLCVNPAKAHASSLAPPDVENGMPSGAQSHGGGGFWEWLEKFF
jgi:hypothetical protein